MFDDMLTLAQAAQVINLAPATLRYYAEGRRAPRLPARQMGRAWVVTRADLLAWHEQYKALPERGRRRS